MVHVHPTQEVVGVGKRILEKMLSISLHVYTNVSLLCGNVCGELWPTC